MVKNKLLLLIKNSGSIVTISHIDSEIIINFFSCSAQFYIHESKIFFLFVVMLY
jgi:hypothetical protein